MLTFREMLDELRDRLSDPSLEPDGVTTRKVRWSDTVLKLKLNLGMEDIVSRTVCLKSSVDINTVEGTREYAITTAIAPNFMGIDHEEEVTYGATDAEKVRLDFKTIGDLDIDDSEWRNADAGVPEKYYLKRFNIIGLAPSPDADNCGTGYLRVPYILKPTTMAGDNDKPFNGEVGFTNSDCNLIIIWVLQQIRREEGKVDEAAQLWGEYLSGCSGLYGRKHPVEEAKEAGLKPHSKYARRD